MLFFFWWVSGGGGVSIPTTIDGCECMCACMRECIHACMHVQDFASLKESGKIKRERERD